MRSSACGLICVTVALAVAVMLEYVIRHALKKRRLDQWRWDRWDSLTLAIALVLLLLAVIMHCTMRREQMQWYTILRSPAPLITPPSQLLTPMQPMFYTGEMKPEQLRGQAAAMIPPGTAPSSGISSPDVVSPFPESGSPGSPETMRLIPATPVIQSPAVVGMYRSPTTQPLVTPTPSQISPIMYGTQGGTPVVFSYATPPQQFATPETTPFMTPTLTPTLPSPFQGTPTFASPMILTPHTGSPLSVATPVFSAVSPMYPSSPFTWSFPSPTTPTADPYALSPLKPPVQAA